MTDHIRPRLSRRLAASSLLAAGVIASALLAASPASAASSGQSCWQNVDTGETGCFDSSLDPIEQIELATGKPLVADATGDPSGLAARATAADENFLLFTGWDEIDFEGDSQSYFTSEPSLCNGTSYTRPNLGTWSDLIDSFQTFNGCVATLYDGILFSGDSFGPAASSSDLGTFSNRTSSMLID